MLSTMKPATAARPILIHPILVFTLLSSVSQARPLEEANVIYPATGTAVQQAKLTAPDGVAGDDFGYSVAVDGTTALVGAFGNASFTGAAYVYVKTGATWTEQAKLTAADGASFNNFGSSVALKGDTALVGAFENLGSIGAVYVFVRNGTTWTQQAKLVAANGLTSDQFGYSVSLGANVAVIGAPQAANLNGAAYVFTRTGVTWKQQATLTASDGAAFDSFGVSVAVSGTTALVGARNHASNGAAYVFAQSGGKWTQQAKLSASDGAAFDEFGSAVALSGGTALVGAYNNANLGAAYAFVQSGTQWQQQAKLTNASGSPQDNFGSAVSVSGDMALIGSPFRGYGTGAGYLFLRQQSAWTFQTKLIAQDWATSDELGRAVAFSGSVVILGAPFKAVSMGAAYVYNVPLAASSPNAGAVGAPITLAGSGFQPNELVYLTWHSPKVYLGSVTADANGNFSGMSTTVPAGAVPGMNTIYAEGATSKFLGIAYFTAQ